MPEEEFDSGPAVGPSVGSWRWTETRRARIDGMDLLRMRWADVLFAHWPVAPDVVAQQLPAGLSVDSYDGEAYLGVVGFEMESIRPRGVPVGRSFPELNLRTYVDGPSGPGVYFFSLDADDRLGVTVARRLFRLSYYRASMSVESGREGVRFSSRRTHRGAPSAAFDATYHRGDDAEQSEHGSLEAFLTERYRFYAHSDRGRLFVGEIEHDPWELAEGTLDIERNELFTANGFESPAGDPHVRYSPGVDVTAGGVQRL